MSEINNLFTSFKLASDPSITSISIPVYNPQIPTVTQVLETMLEKVQTAKDRAQLALNTNITWRLSNPSLEKYETTNPENSSEQQTTKSQNLGETMNIGGMEVPKSWVENKWKQECGTSFGTLDEKHRRGKVVRSNSGKADTKDGKKTYGPGLLYHPETEKPMQDTEPEGGYSTKELTRLFLVTLEKRIQHAKSLGCKTWYQAAAYGGVEGNFGANSPVTKKLLEMIRTKKSDQEIFNFIAHASDRQRSEFPGLITRRMWEARTWIGDFDPNGSRSAENKKKVLELNSGRATSAKFGGNINKVKHLLLGGIAETVDKSLDGLGTWGKLGVQMIDPTGITSWKDLGDSIKVFQKSGSLKDAGMLGLSALGAVPMLGFFKGIGKGIINLGSKSASKATIKALKKELTNVVENCIKSKTISETNKIKIIELSKEVDKAEKTTNSAETIFKFIEEKISPELKYGGNIQYFI